MKKIIKSSRILSEGNWINGYLTIEDGKITNITESIDANQEVEDYGNQRILPGIIDIHIHGYGGWSMTDPATIEDVIGFSKAMSSVGVTTFLPTAKEPAFEAIADAMKLPHEGAYIYGIHSEGPYWARGGENTVGVEWPLPSVEETKRLIKIAKGQMKIMAIAPELPGAYDVIRYLHSEGVLVASAHTKAKYQEMHQAIETVKIDSVTHLCNGMQGIHHRDVGALGAYLLEDRLYYELIADMYHSSPEMLKLIFKCQPFDKIMLISDSSYISGLTKGRYERYNSVTYYDGKEKLWDANGRLWGSGTYVLYHMKALHDVLGLTLEQTSMMASLIPARFLGIEETCGSIALQKDADFFVMDDNYICKATYVKGKLVYDEKVAGPETYINKAALSRRIGDLD